VTEGELAEAVAEVSGNEFVGTGMGPGDVRRHSKKADLDGGVAALGNRAQVNSPFGRSSHRHFAVRTAAFEELRGVSAPFSFSRLKPE
jgi:hypothetical protein